MKSLKEVTGVIPNRPDHFVRTLTLLSTIFSPLLGRSYSMIT